MKKEIITLLAALMMAVSVSLTAYAENFQQAGKTDCGILYVDTDSVTTVKKADTYYLAVMAEEKYTDAEFLKILRQGEGLENASSALILYLFNNNGSAYCIAANYILDDKGRVCLDMGSDMTLRQIGKDKTLTKAYTTALKAMENKKRFSFKR